MNETKETKVEVTATNTEKEAGFLKKSWMKSKDFIKKHKGALIGATVGSAATIAGLFYLGSNSENSEAVNGETPTEE